MIAENTYELKEMALQGGGVFGSGGGDEGLDVGDVALGAGGTGGSLFALNKIRKMLGFGKDKDAKTKTADKDDKKQKKKVDTKNVSKATKKQTSKLVAKSLTKAAIKKIPVLGFFAGAGFALGRLLEGDVTGAGMELASGTAAIVPGIGTGGSVAIDAALLAKDLKEAETEGSAEVLEEEGGKKFNRYENKHKGHPGLNRIKNNVATTEQVIPHAMSADMVSIDSKRTEVRTSLDLATIENELSKLSTKMNDTNIAVNNGGNNINNNNNTTQLPDMKTDNTDQTIITLKNIY